MGWLKRVMERGQPPVVAPYATTPRGYPFPLRSWPPDAAVDIQNLANAVDTDMGKTSRVAFGSATTDTGGYANITFPAGKFTAVPSVVACPVAADAVCLLEAGTTTTTARIRALARGSGAGVQVGVYWIAAGN